VSSVQFVYVSAFIAALWFALIAWLTAVYAARRNDDDVDAILRPVFMLTATLSALALFTSIVGVSCSIAEWVLS